MKNWEKQNSGEVYQAERKNPNIAETATNDLEVAKVQGAYTCNDGYQYSVQTVMRTEHMAPRAREAVVTTRGLHRGQVEECGGQVMKVDTVNR